MSLLSEHIPSHPSLEQQPQQPASTPPNLPHLCDQLVPKGFRKDSAAPPSGKDFEDLRLAISHLRAERRAHVQSLHTVSPNRAAREDPGEVIQDPGINSVLQMELGEEEAMTVGTDGERSRGAESRGARKGDPARALVDPSSGSVPKPSTTTTAMLSDQAQSSRHEGKEAGRSGEPAFPGEADRGASKTSEQDTTR